MTSMTLLRGPIVIDRGLKSGLFWWLFHPPRCRDRTMLVTFVMLDHSPSSLLTLILVRALSRLDRWTRDLKGIIGYDGT